MSYDEVVTRMSMPEQAGVPDHVPEEWLRQPGSGAATNTPHRRPPAAADAPAAGRAEGRVLGLGLACCLAVVAAVLTALVLVTPSPLITAAGLVALLVAAAVCAWAAGHVLQRDARADHYHEDRADRPRR